MKAIIFGNSGQDGHYLEKALSGKKYNVLGYSRSSMTFSGDVSDWEFVSDIIKTHQPKLVFHLAAISSTHHDSLFANHAAIGTGVLNVLESVYRYSPETRVFITGSGLQFHNKGTPISESTEFNATSPYCIERIHSVYAARYYRQKGVKVYVGYLFHHDSPLRKENHVSMMIASFAKKISQGDRSVLDVGNLAVEKEWGFAGDIVNGIITLISQDKIYEAIIGTGKSFTIQNWCEACFELIGEDWTKFIRQKNGRKNVIAY